MDLRLSYGAGGLQTVMFDVHWRVPVFHLRGFVRIQDQVYLIEPLADAEADVQGAKHSSEMPSDGGLHAVYNYKHLRRKRSSCSHGNGTTFYDHGARPSALFKLSSLVIIREHWSRQTFEPTCESKLLVLFYSGWPAPILFYSEKQRSDQRACGETQDSGDGCGGRPHRGLKRKLPHFQVIDRRRVWLLSSFLLKYKKFGSIKTVQSRVLEAANHVDKVRLSLCSCSAETTLCWIRQARVIWCRNIPFFQQIVLMVSSHWQKKTFFSPLGSASCRNLCSYFFFSYQKKRQKSSLWLQDDFYASYMNRSVSYANMLTVWQLYRPVGIRVMLVGLDIWSNRDQIDVSSDSELTLGRFLKWRQWKLLPDIKHDNAQFIT